MKIIKLFTFNIFLLGIFTAQGSIVLQQNDKSAVILVSPDLTFRFAPAKLGLGLVSILDSDKVEFMAQSQQRPRLWRIKLTAKRQDKNAFVTVFNYSSCRERKVEYKDGKVYFKWLGVQVNEEKNALDVTTEISLDKVSNMTAFKIKVRNNSKKYGIWHLYYPELTLGQIGEKADNDYLLMSPAEGRAIRNPIYWDKALKIKKDAFMLTTDAMVKISNNQTSNGYGFGSQEPYGLPYPSTRGQLQLCAYYQKDGNYYYPSDKKDSGLYLAAHDNQASPKVFYASPFPKQDLLRFAIGQFPADSAKPGLDFEQQWPMIIGSFKGDWFDAAMIYRNTFALKAPWLKKGPLATRKDVPQWLKDTTVWMRLDNSRGRKIDSEYHRIMQFREYLSGQLAVQWYAWDDALKPKYRGCGSFPPIATAQKGFKTIVDKFKSHKIAVTPYITTRLWTYNDPEQITRQPFSKAKPWGMREANDKLSIWNNRGIRMCVHTNFWKNYLAQVSKNIVSTYGVQGIYLDEGAAMSFGGGSYGSQSCFDSHHGHPLGVTTALSQAEHQRMKMILDACDSVQKQTVLTGEGSSENFIDVVVSKLIHYEIWPGYVPLYSAVYHDYATAYGRTIKLKASNPSDPLPQMTMGWQLVIGNQLGRLWPENFTKSKLLRKNFKYLMKISAVKAAYPEFLNLGRMLRPPYINGVSNLTTGEFSRINHICSLPSVVAGTWQSPQGNIGIILTNMDDKKQKFTMKIDLADYGIKGKYSLEQTFPASKTLAVSDAKSITLNMSLPAREISFIQISPDAKKLPVIKYVPKKLLPPMPRKSFISDKYPGIPNIIKDLKFSEDLTGWKNNNPKAFILKQDDSGKYLEFKNLTERKYSFICGSIPDIDLSKGRVFKFGAKVNVIIPSGKIELAIRLVNAQNKTITYRRIVVPAEKNGWQDYSRSFRLEHKVKYLQFYIIASNVNAQTIAKFKDLSFIMVR